MCISFKLWTADYWWSNWGRQSTKYDTFPHKMSYITAVLKEILLINISGCETPPYCVRLINRPGVAGAVLQTPLSLICWVTDALPPDLQNIITPHSLEPRFLITQCTLRIHQRQECVLRATGYFTDFTLTEKNGQFPAADSVILKVIKPTFKKFLKENGHPHPLIYSGNFWPLTPICAYTCRTCSSLTLPSIMTPTWPAWGQPGC